VDAALLGVGRLFGPDCQIEVELIEGGGSGLAAAAIQQRGPKPATKIVLWFLCDRHNLDFGCFPKQARLAEDAEMSISALNEHLATLEKLGLIHRIRAHDPHNHRRLPTRYILGFERDSRKSHLRKAETGLLKSQKKTTAHPRKQHAGPTPDFRLIHLRILAKAISGIQSITL